MKKPDWKIRAGWRRLTPAELEIVRAGFETWRPARDVARELECGPRTIFEHYAKFKGKVARTLPKPPRVMRNNPGPGTLENPRNNKPLAWIAAHLQYDGDDCLMWPFSKTRDGYGVFGIAGKSIRAARFICQEVNGPPPTPEHHAAHSCGQGHDGCVHPRHLSWKTNSENQFDRTDDWPRKLTEESAAEILSMAGQEPSYVTAARFGLREATVRQIQTGKIWRRLQSPQTPGAA